MGFAADPALGETLRKKLADPDVQRAFGRVFVRAVALAGWTLKEVAARLGHADQSSVSRWVSGVEPVPMAKLWAVRELRSALVQALAEDTTDVDIGTVVTIRRRRRA